MLCEQIFAIEVGGAVRWGLTRLVVSLVNVVVVACLPLLMLLRRDLAAVNVASPDSQTEMKTVDVSLPFVLGTEHLVATVVG